MKAAFPFAFYALQAFLLAASPVDLLIVAPHPDDEVIGCSGVMMQALEEGKKVAVVVMTNGEGFPKGTSAITGKAKEDLTPDDFFSLARLRQEQSYGGIHLVGLCRKDIQFLSYPDGGLAKIYQAEKCEVYTNRHTGKSQTYSLLGKDYHTQKHGKPAPYTREYILSDLEGILSEREPSEVYVTTHFDQHSDHRAAFWYVRDAAKNVGFKGKLYTYLVHGHRIPPGKPRRVVLTPSQLETKKAAIGVHKIPMVHDHLVEAHAKPEEAFWLAPKFQE